ncbi:hypothetical protein SDC9_28837 [bioreactor metagenome]|uniref:Uncharacterized protein n=1 Tax=bioreactor metagenome TaxID=1076179 RepID=A0A644UUX4_9ZZZZ
MRPLAAQPQLHRLAQLGAAVDLDPVARGGAADDDVIGPTAHRFRDLGTKLAQLPLQQAARRGAEGAGQHDGALDDLVGEALQPMLGDIRNAKDVGEPGVAIGIAHDRGNRVADQGALVGRDDPVLDRIAAGVVDLAHPDRLDQRRAQLDKPHDPFRLGGGDDVVAHDAPAIAEKPVQRTFRAARVDPLRAGLDHLGDRLVLEKFGLEIVEDIRGVGIRDAGDEGPALGQQRRDLALFDQAAGRDAFEEACEMAEELTIVRHTMDRPEGAAVMVHEKGLSDAMRCEALRRSGREASLTSPSP